MDKLDLNKGEIYLITNTKNNKQYVGQAAKYVSRNNFKWGTQGRWKSHVREALSGKSDHCLLLNSAIRKYGVDAFTVEVIQECNREDMNRLEEEYIHKYNSLTPNGYNLKLGIVSDSKETRERKSASRLGKKHSEETKAKISQGQLGNRRQAKTRKHEEDNDLPKYIGCIRKDGKIIGYKVVGYPIGTTVKEYYTKEFKDINNIEACLTKAKEHLAMLEEKHADTIKDIEANRQQLQNEAAVLKIQQKKESFLQAHEEEVNKAFEGNKYVHAIIQDTKIAGYYVEGLSDYEGNPIPRKEFCSNLNRWNLDKALRFIGQVETLNKSKTKVTNWDDIDAITRRTKNGVGEEFLPKFINRVNAKGQHVGYCVNGVPYEENGEKKKYYKKFTKSSLSMQERYNAAIKHLNELKLDPKYIF